ERPALVDRLVLFAPIARRDPSRYSPRPNGPAWRVVSVEDQWARFVEDVQPDEPPVLSPVHFKEWARRYLDTDPQRRSRDPAGVKVPSGPFIEILSAWHGEAGYERGGVRAPTAIIRGSWHGLVCDADPRWLFDALSTSPTKRDGKIARVGAGMHLEA